MRTRTTVFLAALGILLLPCLISRPGGNRFSEATFSQVAYAGHVLSNGRKCECGGPIPDCICDEGETPNSYAVSPPSDDTEDAPSQPGDPNDSSLGSTALLLVLALLVWRFGH